MSIVVTTALVLGYGWGHHHTPAPKPTYVTMGSEIAAGDGASSPDVSAATLFADYLDDTYFERSAARVSLAEAGATSSDVLTDQSFAALLINAIAHPEAQKVVWLEPASNDWWPIVQDPDFVEACTQVPEVEGAAYAKDCYLEVAKHVEAYEHTLESILWVISLANHVVDVEVVLQATFNPLSEANCAADGAVLPNGELWLTPDEVAGVKPLGDIVLNCTPPPPPSAYGLDPDAAWSLNEANEQIATAHGMVWVNNYREFEVLSRSPDTDLVGPDCRLPNDEGHAFIYSLTIDRFESHFSSATP